MGESSYGYSITKFVSFRLEVQFEFVRDRSISRARGNVSSKYCRIESV